MDRCRVCGTEFFYEPLLQYANMPRAAQFLPDSESIKTEKSVDLEVHQCSGCGLVQLSNEPVSYFREVIRAAAFSEEMKAFRMKQFGDFLKKYALINKKVIEIGCGRGEYLSIMGECGADTYGLEYLAESVAFCLKNGLKVTKGFIEDSQAKLPGAHFDAFFMLNFLEHLPNLNDVLRGIHNNLTDDGIGLVEVPNFDMILRKNLFSEFIGDHLLYFTKDTLTTALMINGFEVIECHEVWYDYIISAVVKKRNRLDISVFYKHQEKLKKEIQQYISRFKEQNVAIWGAGHQALAVLSLTQLRGKIRYVVDSAPFKQNKFTPATHIPIVAPELLNTDPVDAVIVMAASYSDEVADILRKKYCNINVAILRDYGLEEVN